MIWDAILRERLAWTRAAVIGAAALAVAILALVVAGRPRSPKPAGPVHESLATVTADVAELKREPSARAATLERLPRGTRLDVLAPRGRWFEVQTASQSRGFLLAETFETDSDRQARDRRALKIFSFSPVAGIVIEDTDVLLAPLPLAPRAGHLRRGSAISIHAVDHDYYAFRSADGGVAFVSSADVDLVPPDPRRPAILPEKGKTLKDLTVADLGAVAPTPPPGEAAEDLDRPPGEESPAVLESKVEPRYPESARAAGVEGTVVLDIRIDESGRVTDIQVLRGLPLGVSQAAVEAVSRWRYRPARGRAGPVAARKIVRVQFSFER